MVITTEKPISDLDNIRRNILLIVLALGTPAVFFGYRNALDFPAATQIDANLTLVLAVIMTVLLVWSLFRRSATQAAALIFIVAIWVLMGLRLAFNFLGPMADMPLEQLKPPYTAWLPLAFVLSFVLLQSRLALWLSIAFYASTSIVVMIYALGVEGPWNSAHVALLLQFLFAHAMYIALLAMVPILNQRYTQSLKEVDALRAQGEAERRLASVVEVSQDAIIVVDINGNISHWNPAAEALYGYSPDEIIGRSARCLFPPEVEPMLEQNLQKVSRGESARYADTVRLAKSGERIDVQVASTPIRDANGDVVGAAVTTHDIRASKRAQRALQQSEERFRGTFDNAPIGLALVSSQGRFTQVNAALCEIVGYSQEELLQIDFQTLTHPDDLDADLAYVQQLLADEIQSYRMDKRYFHKNGTTVWIVLAVSLVRDADGAPLHFVSQIEDVTEARKAQAELERSNADLEAYAHVVSHDLREPLRGISGFVKLLDKKLADNPDTSIQQYLDFIRDGVSRAETLISDLLEYARSGGERETQTLDSDALLAEVLNTLHIQIESCGGRIDHEPLPAVRANASDFRRILQNLVGNAIKFSALGKTEGESPQVSISSQREGRMQRINIRDNGPGIPPESKAEVFQIFRRLHGQNVSGTGIGLAICKKLVESHGGEIGVESEFGHGACFHFTLPAA